MPINKRTKKAKNDSEAHNDESGDYGSKKPLPQDPSNFAWLEIDTIPLVDDAELHKHCLEIILDLKKRKIPFGRFVWAINYGNKASRDDCTMRSARTSFAGQYLVSTLQNIRAPPRTSAKGERAKGGKEFVDKFALAITALRLREEMRAFEGDYENVQPKSFSQKDFLKSMDYDSIAAAAHSLCPILFCLLFMLSTCVYRRRHWASNKSNASFFIVLTICCMAHQLSSANNAFQRLLGYYFRAKHVPKSVINMLSELNLSMSYNSIIHTTTTLATSIRQAAVQALRERPFLVVHDNLRIRHAVRSQRHNSQTVTDNGTAMTVIILPESARPAWEDPEAVSALRLHIEEQRALQTPVSLQYNHLTCPLRQERVLQHKLYHIIDILRFIPGMRGLDILSHPLLQRPPGWHQLEASPDSVTEQFMLSTRPIDESSYSGNLMVLRDVLQQAHMDSGDELMRLALERMTPWVGDELTVSRLRMLQWLRQEEKNAYDRLDPFIFIFGWFHLLMNLGFSIFENHRGSVAGLGMIRTAHTLQRMGFSQNMRKHRPDYHTVLECLLHDLESRVRDYWLLITNTSSTDELKLWIMEPTQTPEAILSIAKRIQLTQVSRQALPLYEADLLDSHENPDTIYIETLLQNRDLELFWDVRHAVKHGNVGHMEDLLPDLLVFFTGGRNTNYARQMYEHLQTLYHESTPAIRHSIRENAWLVNMSGRENGFYPIDQRQELNNGGIKKHGPIPQGGSSWEDIAKISPLIPVYMDIVKHVEESITGIQRSHVHKDPSWEKDLQILMNDHSLTKALIPVPGRDLESSSSTSKDYFKLGSTILQDTDALERYAKQHAPFFKSRVTTNDFSNYIVPPSESPPEQPGSPESSSPESLYE